jgi:flavin-binding protein dodecin
MVKVPPLASLVSVGGRERPGVCKRVDREPMSRSLKEEGMSIAKVTEIIASSSKSFEDAVQEGVKRANKTLEKVSGAWIKDQKVVVDKGKVTEYRVTMRVSFILKD